MPGTAGRPRNNNPVFVDNDIDAEAPAPNVLGSGGGAFTTRIRFLGRK